MHILTFAQCSSWYIELVHVVCLVSRHFGQSHLTTKTYNLCMNCWRSSK